MKLKNCLYLLVCVASLRTGAWAQPTVSTGNTKYVVLESTVSVQVGFSPQAYCIEDSLRVNSKLIFLNYHLNNGSLLDTLYNGSVSSWMNGFGMNSIPSGLIDREPYNSSLQVGRQNWGAACGTRLATTPQYKLAMTVSRNGQQLHIFLQGTALTNLTGEYRFNAAITEDSIIYNQSNFYTSGSCAYMSGGNPIPGFTHRDVLRNLVAGAYGNVAATNPTINQVDTMSLYFNIPAYYNTNRLRVTGLVQKYGSTSSDRAILNAISVKVSDICQLVVTAHPTNQGVVEGNAAQFSVSTSSAATYQWQAKTGSSFQNLTNAGQYSGVNSSTLTVSNVTLSNQGTLFRCVITAGLCADTSQAALLNVLCGPQISTQPLNQQTAKGSTASFSLTALAPLSQKQWQTDLGTGFVNLSNAGQYSGVTTSQLQLSNVNASNNNQLFRCIVTNAGCADTSAIAKLIVTCAPLITAQPQNSTVAAGATAIFTLGATTGANTFAWQTDFGFGYQNLSNAGQYSGTNTGTLAINNTTASNNDQLFRCIVNQAACIDTSNAAKLNITAPSGIYIAATSNNIAVYPNPARTQLTVMLTPELKGESFTLTDVTGKCVYKGVFTQPEETISLKELLRGLYFLNSGNRHTKFYITAE